MKQTDTEFFLTNISNLTGLTVRVLNESDESIFFYSPTKLSIDPLLFLLEKTKSNEKIYYFIDDYLFYYGVLKVANNMVILGPTRQLDISSQSLNDYAFSLKVSINDLDSFINSIKTTPNMPLSSLLQLLCTLNFVLNKGEKVNMKDLNIYESKQRIIAESLEKEKALSTLNSVEGETKKKNNSYNIEQTILSYIRKGEVDLLKEYFTKIPIVHSGILSRDLLRQYVDMFIVTATLASRSAIRGGLDIDEALKLSDAYIQKCEAEKNVNYILNLQYHMIIDYATRVEKLKYGETNSKLVSEVINYVRANLSSPITTEDISRNLFISRSHLSVKFKEETGENISTFITNLKIDEAKRLLRYSDKPLSLIAIYLGYSSQSHFARVFKNYTSLTPNEYRGKF